MTTNVLGQRIREARKKRKLTIAQLAEKVGISNNFMGKVDRGEDVPSLATLILIANEVHLNVDYLLEDKIDVCKHLENNDEFYVSKINKDLDSMNENQKKEVLHLVELLMGFNEK